MDSRERVLEAVRRALVDVGDSGGPPDTGVRVDAPPSTAGQVVESLRRQLESVLQGLDAQVLWANTPDECAGHVVEIARTSRAGSALLSHHPLLERLELEAKLQGSGVEVIGRRGPARLDAADLGVAVSEWAVCSTGTLVLSSHREQLRSASLLPPASVIVQTAAGLLPDLTTLFSLPAFTRLEGSLIFVSGPSRTGDIELTLTKGVHGPGLLYVVILDDQERG